MPFSALIKLSAFLKYGLLALIAGIGLFGWSMTTDLTMPARSELQTVEGLVTSAKRVTVKRRRGGESVHFELTVDAKDAPGLKLKIPQAAVTEASVRRVIGRPTRFETDGGTDVYVMATGGQEFVTYAQSVKSRHESNVVMAQIGAAIAGFGLLLAGLGYGLARRKANRLLAEQTPPQGPAITVA
ncbi:MAG: hypothetical protein ACRCYS_10180 [Beijerinckiaceae bacterium]